jgi:hypothetical protein
MEPVYNTSVGIQNKCNFYSSLGPLSVLWR